jgi:hypothetical protein
MEKLVSIFMALVFCIGVSILVLELSGFWDSPAKKSINSPIKTFPVFSTNHITWINQENGKRIIIKLPCKLSSTDTLFSYHNDAVKGEYIDGNKFINWTPQVYK